MEEFRDVSYCVSESQNGNIVNSEAVEVGKASPDNFHPLQGQTYNIGLYDAEKVANCFCEVAASVTELGISYATD